MEEALSEGVVEGGEVGIKVGPCQREGRRGRGRGRGRGEERGLRLKEIIVGFLEVLFLCVDKFQSS